MQLLPNAAPALNTACSGFPAMPCGVSDVVPDVVGPQSSPQLPGPRATVHPEPASQLSNRADAALRWLPIATASKARCAPGRSSWYRPVPGFSTSGSATVGDGPLTGSAGELVVGMRTFSSTLHSVTSGWDGSPSPLPSPSESHRTEWVALS